MRQTTLATAGNFTQTAYVPGQGYLAIYQQGAQVILASVEPVADQQLLVIVLARHPLGGQAAAFPRIAPDPRGGYVLAWRRGAPPYRLCTVIQGTYTEHHIEVHGNYPVALGDTWIAFQDTPDYRLRRCRIWEDLTQAGFVGHGRPTGISHIDRDGRLAFVDTIKAMDPPGVYKSWAGPVVAREADGVRGPEVRLVHADGRSLALWPGQESVFPWVATDGVSYLVGTEGKPGGVRCALVEDVDLQREMEIPPPFGVPVDTAKALGYFFDDGRYGRFAPARTTTITGAGLWQDGDGDLPEDVNLLLASAIRRAGTAFLAAGDVERPTMRDLWSRVLGVWTHEPDTPETAARWVTAARVAMDRASLPRRPVVTILTEREALRAEYRGIGDALAPEIYFDRPEATYADQLLVARARIEAVCRALAPTPLYLVVQAYDRSLDVWRAAPYALAAIQQACNEALRREQVRGLWWFAYGRPGGVRSYPILEAWHAAQVALTPAPSLITDPEPTKPPKESHVLPNQVEVKNFFERLHVEGYIHELRRAGGIFESPDPANSVVKDPRREGVVLDSAFVVHFSSYLHYYQTEGHDGATRHVLRDLHDSHEARSKRGEIGNPQ